MHCPQVDWGLCCYGIGDCTVRWEVTRWSLAAPLRAGTCVRACVRAHREQRFSVFTNALVGNAVSFLVRGHGSILPAAAAYCNALDGSSRCAAQTFWTHASWSVVSIGFLAYVRRVRRV